MTKNLINIPHPCHEDTGLMPRTGHKMYCSQCDKNVHNISDLSSEDARALLEKNHGEEICLSFRLTEKGEIGHLEDDDPRPSNNQLEGVRKLLAAALFIPLALTQVAMAGTAINAVNTSIEANESPSEILSKVMAAEVSLLTTWPFPTIEEHYTTGINDAVITDVQF